MKKYYVCFFTFLTANHTFLDDIQATLDPILGPLM